MTSFISVVFSVRSSLRQIEKQRKVSENPGACSPGKFSKIYVL